jgi:DNA-binding transcriptional LysR family regulator
MAGSNRNCLGFLRDPSKERVLTYETVLDEVFIFALPPEHKFAKRSQVDLAELAEEPIGYFPSEIAPTLYDRTIVVCQAAGFTPHVVQEAIDWITIFGLVEVGFGVSLAPASFHKLGWGCIKYRRLNHKDLRTTVSVSFISESLSPPAKEFIKLVKEKD